MYVGPQLDKRFTYYSYSLDSKYKIVIVIIVVAVALAIVAAVILTKHKNRKNKMLMLPNANQTFIPNMAGGNNGLNPVIISSDYQPRPVPPMTQVPVERSEYTDPIVDPPPLYTPSKNPNVDADLEDFTRPSTAPPPQASPSAPPAAYVRY